MEERRNSPRTVNGELSSSLCLARIIFSDGASALGRVLNLSGEGVRLMVPSGDCAERISCGDGLSVDLIYANLSFQGRCVYMQELPYSVTAMGIAFAAGRDAAVLGVCIAEALRLQAV